jgi:hypothetical protein
MRRKILPVAVMTPNPELFAVSRDQVMRATNDEE